MNDYSKRTEQLNIRVTAEIKNILQEQAKKLDWAPTKLAEKILGEWTNKAKNNQANVFEFVKQKERNDNDN